VRTATIELGVPGHDFTARYDRARAVAAGLGGYVVSSEMADGGGSDRTATLELRVPGGSFDRALDMLGRVGHVNSQDVQSQDVTQDYVDTTSRLRHDREVAARLELLLRRANTVGDTLDVQSHLDDVQQQIEVEQGRITYLGRLSALATIDVTLVQRGAAAHHRHHHAGGYDWGITTAFSDAAHRFVANVNRAIVALGGALPALIVLALVLLGGRTWMRRRGGRAADRA
jgi:hypothetical protein